MSAMVLATRGTRWYARADKLTIDAEIDGYVWTPVASVPDARCRNW